MWEKKWLKEEKTWREKKERRLLDPNLMAQKIELPKIIFLGDLRIASSLIFF